MTYKKETRLHHEQLEFKFMAEIQKLSAKQLIRAAEIAAAHNIRLQRLQSFAVSGGPDVTEPAKVDLFKEFGGQADVE